MQSLILASNSPRRKQILADAGIRFTVHKLDTDESYPAALEKSKVACYLAEKKNAAYRKRLKSGLILTADTTVLCDGKLLEKPVDEAEAFDMLRAISGREHSVISGVCLSKPEHTTSFDDTTKVWFRQLTDQEIMQYIQQHKPYDKAGAYGIQEQIGLIGITKIEGSYYNVMGLPIHQVYQSLKDQFGFFD